jgi:hypothetical protein
MAKPAEIADLALYLCSDQAAFVTGVDYRLTVAFSTYTIDDPPYRTGEESKLLLRVSLYETSSRSVVTSIVPVQVQRSSRQPAFLLGIASLR